MNNAKVVYHASPLTDIEEFQPKNEHTRDQKEGLVIFATPNKAVASMFLVNTDDRWVACGLMNHVPYMVISNKNEFTKLDSGGAIYTLQADGFVADPNLGMGDMELTSKKLVKPLGKELYESGLAAMLSLGVQVYFVDQITFDSIKVAKDHGLSILRKSRSENQRQSINKVSL